MDSATIFALSSGRPPAAIAIIRISGPRAVEAARALSATVAKPRTLALRLLRDPRDGVLLDEALVAWFPAAGSATGEDLVELHLHGGPATVAGVEAALAAIPGLRVAEAGEFTFRAFANGKLDLLQVEGLSNLLRAETEHQRRAAIAASAGALSAKIGVWQTRLLHLSALVEAELDHSDEDDVRPDRGEAPDRARTLHAELSATLSRPTTERLFDGIRVAVAGPPNAGKSTLINALAGREAAIVSPVEGTTRDVIEVPVRLGGTGFVLIDMAGLREGTEDLIEREGIARARAQIDSADLVLWLGDDEPPPEAIALHPRCELPGRQLTVPSRLSISAVTGHNIDTLVALLIDQASALLPAESENALTRRQNLLVRSVSDELAAFLAQADPLLGAEHLRVARREFDRLTGRSATGDMLSALFSTFCIGK